MLPAKKYQEGLVDPLSLFALGFLVISLFVGTAVVSNPNFVLDIRQRAREVEDEGISAIVKRPTTTTKKVTPAPSKKEDSTSTGPTPYCSRFNKEDCAFGCEPTKSGGTCKSGTSTTTTTTTTAPTPTSYCSKFNQEDCVFGCEPTTSGGKCKSGSSTPTTAAPTPTPYCSRFNQEDCAFGCEPTTDGGKCKSASATSTPIATPTPYCSRFNQEDCAYGCEPTTNGGTCKTKAEAGVTTTPSPTIAPTTTTSNAYLTCLAQGNSPGECAAILSPTPTVTATVTTTPSSPAPTTTVIISLKANGQKCNLNSECASGNCQSASGGKYCFPAGTAYQAPPGASPTPTPVQPELTLLQQIELSVAQTGLNLITSFNETGVAEHVRTQGEAISVDAKVIEQAITGQDLGGGRAVNAGIAVYSFLDILSRPLTLGAASLDDVRLASINWAATNAEANARGAAITDPDRLAAAAEAGVKGTALVTSVASVVGFTPAEAAAELYSNPTYYRYAGQYTGRAYTAAGRLVERAESALGFTDDAYRYIQAQEVVPMPTGVPDYAEFNYYGAQEKINASTTLQTSVDAIPDSVTVEGTGEVITLGEQLGSSGSQGSAYLGTRCTGARCVIKLFNTTEAGFEPANTAQIDYMQRFGTAENVSRGVPLPEYYGAVTNQQGQRIGYAMEYKAGETATKIIDTQGGLTYQQATEIFDKATALQEATGLPHGDIANYWYEGKIPHNLNTNNIIITPEGKAVFIDPSGLALDTTPNPMDAAVYMEQEINNLRTWLQDLVIQ